MDRGNVVGILVVVIAALAVNLWVMYGPSEGGEAVPPSPAERFAIAPSEPVEPVEPIGPGDAPVSVAVFYQPENPCHDHIEPQARGLAERYAPRIRVELLPWFAEGTRERAEQLTVDCLVTVEVSGPPPIDEESPEPETVEFTGPTEIGAWTWDDVAKVVEMRLTMAGVTPEPNAAPEDAERPGGESTHG